MRTGLLKVKGKAHHEDGDSSKRREKFNWGHAQTWSLLRTELLKAKKKLTEDGDSSK